MNEAAYHQTKLRLLYLAQQHPQEITSAGARLGAKIDASAEESLRKKRHAIQEELFHISEGVRLAKTSGELREDSARDTISNSLAMAHANALREFAADGGDLSGDDALDVYLRAYVHFYLKQAKELGEVVEKSEDDLREARRAELDSDAATVATNRPAFLLARWGWEQMREPLDLPRTTEQRWELVCLALCVEAPELAPSQLGLPEDLHLGGWHELGSSDIFGARDGMRSYMGRANWDDEKGRHDGTFWRLVQIAADHLIVQHHPEMLERLVGHEPGGGPYAGAVGPGLRKSSTLGDLRHAELDAGGSESQPVARREFRWDGGVWAVRFEGEECKLPPRAGLTYIHELLMRPNRHVDAEALFELQSKLSPGVTMPRRASSDLVRHPDPVARERYQARLEALREERAAAVESSDEQAIAKCDEDTAAIEREMRRGGAERRSRNRSADLVGKAITREILNFLKVAPRLGRHLKESIRQPSSRAPCYEPADDLPWVT